MKRPPVRRIGQPSELGQGTDDVATKPGRSSRFALVNDFRRHSLRHLGSSAAVVWFLLWTYADGGGVVRMMSRKRIAEETGLSEETVKRSIKELTPRHLVRLGGGITGHTSVYRLRSGTEVWREGNE